MAGPSIQGSSRPVTVTWSPSGVGVRALTWELPFQPCSWLSRKSKSMTLL